MRLNNQRGPAKGFAIALILALLCGCAGLGAGLPPEEAVAKRAQAWADALLAGDLQGAYDFTSPNYRQFSSKGKYHARVEGASGWRSATVKKVECQELVCDATLILEYSARKMRVEVRRPRTYRWVLVEGEWWIYVPLK